MRFEEQDPMSQYEQQIGGQILTFEFIEAIPSI